MIRITALILALAGPAQGSPAEIFTHVVNGFALQMGPVGVEIFELERKAACGEAIDQAKVQDLLARELDARARITEGLEGADLRLAYHILEGLTLLAQNQRLDLVDTLSCPQ